jgi:hypothetical protein
MKKWVVIGVAVLLVGVGVWVGVVLKGQRDRRTAKEAEDALTRIEYQAAVGRMEQLLRMRGDLSAEAASRARRDELLLETCGLTEEEALAVLEAFASKFPDAPAVDWMRAAYAWAGRTPKTAQEYYWGRRLADGTVEEDKDIHRFLQVFMRQAGGCNILSVN